MKTNKQLIDETVEHWERMIAWAKTQGRGIVYAWNMEYNLGECWDSKYCSLCKAFIYDDCIKCPLFLKYRRCGTKGNLWSIVNKSKSWKTWTRNAEKFLKQLKSLREDEN